MCCWPRLSSGPAQSEVADQDSGILSKELGTDPARLLSVSVGKRPDKLMGCNGQDPGRFALWWDLKFSLAPPPAADRRIIRKKTSAGVAVASKPPYSFRRAFGSKNGGPEATATIIRTIASRTPYPTIKHWVTPFLCRKQQIKFQVSSPPALLPHSRKKLLERSLKRWPGVGSSIVALIT